MRAQIVSKITAAIVCAALSLAPALGARVRQSASAATSATKATGNSSTTATSSSKKVVVKPRVIKKRKPRPRVQIAPTAQRISEIQSALATQGAYKAQPNGKWDNATMQAIKDFQASHGLTVTGKLDALTLQKLGMGSEIAGRAAPLPQTPAASSTGQQQTP